MLAQLGFYVPYAWRFVAQRRQDPLICGLALTDRCNLHCTGCHIANAGQGDISFEHACAVLEGAYRRGFRELYFTGGEPMLWRDGERTLEDLIVEARRIGYFHTHLYTNGTLGLRTSADLVWVSMDGLPDVYERRRGDHFAEVEAALREPGHPPAIVIYVVGRDTVDGLEPFLRWVRGMRLPVLGVMVYFHTPYYGKDRLYLDAGERATVIDDMLRMKADGLPLVNSRAGLLALKTGRWDRRTHIAIVVDKDGESFCCRASDEVCEDCGYTPCAEISAAQRLAPSAVLGMARYL